MKKRSKIRRKINRVEKVEKMNLGEEYKKIWKYLSASKFYLKLSIALFILFIITGVVFPVLFRDFIINYIKDILEKTEGLDFMSLVGFIFINNLETSFFSIVLGIFLGFFPIFVLASNGYLLGFISRIVVEQEGAFSLWRLLPHGIFELPAIFISTGIGIKLGIDIMYRTEEEGLLLKELLNIFRVFIFLIIPLLVIAAFIEAGLILFVG